MSGVIESPASLARRHLHKIEDDTDGDGQLEAANGTTSKTEQQQPDEGSIIESKEAAVDAMHILVNKSHNNAVITNDVFLLTSICNHIITPRACARGKVIGYVVVVVVVVVVIVSTKITISRDAGI